MSKFRKALNVFFVLVLFVLFVVAVFGGDKKGSQSKSQPDIKPVVTISADTQKQSAYRVAAKKIDEYELAKGNGDKMKACVLAGHVNIAYLRAEDQEMYGRWRYIEKQRCEEAGVPIKD